MDHSYGDENYATSGRFFRRSTRGVDLLLPPLRRSKIAKRSATR